MDPTNPNQSVDGAPGTTPPTKPPRSNTAGLILIILGILFLLRELFPWWRFDHLWPLLLIGFGLWLVYRRDNRGI